MPILIIFLIWYFGFGRNNPDTYRKIEGKIGKIVVALIILSAFGSLVPALFSLSIGFLVLLLSFSPFLMFGYIVSKIFGIGKSSNKGKADKTSTVSRNNSTEPLTALTKSVPKRKKIIRKFNKKYNLNLTEEEIDRIVDASYMSAAWEREIDTMQTEYSTISQWYTGNTAWLRVYLRVFPVQSISSDFARQREICFNTFSQIFDEINPSHFGSIESCIDAINTKYFASLDESTFMIVYRFLESCGRKYNLPDLGVIKNESDLDRLRRKYDETPNADDKRGARLTL